jgi:NTP pyrophosphatase (non-canonical NTP hydrolase)
MTEWSERVRQWAIDRNLVKGSNPVAQMTKLFEEVDELQGAIAAGDVAETIDAIGDIQVVLGVMCAQLDLDIDQCREAAWEEIKDRKGRMVAGMFVKE